MQIYLRMSKLVCTLASGNKERNYLKINNMNKLTRVLIENTTLFNRFRRINRSLKIDLSGADLRGADLRGAKGMYLFNKLSGRICYAVVHDKKLMIQAGCFWGTLAEFDAACEEVYGNDEAKNYYAQRQYLLSTERSL